MPRRDAESYGIATGQAVEEYGADRSAAYSDEELREFALRDPVAEGAESLPDPERLLNTLEKHELAYARSLSMPGDHPGKDYHQRMKDEGGSHYVRADDLAAMVSLTHLQLGDVLREPEQYRSGVLNETAERMQSYRSNGTDEHRIETLAQVVDDLMREGQAAATGALTNGDAEGISTALRAMTGNARDLMRAMDGADTKLADLVVYKERLSESASESPANSARAMMDYATGLRALTSSESVTLHGAMTAAHTEMNELYEQVSQYNRRAGTGLADMSGAWSDLEGGAKGRIYEALQAQDEEALAKHIQDAREAADGIMALGRAPEHLPEHDPADIERAVEMLRDPVNGQQSIRRMIEEQQQGFSLSEEPRVSDVQMAAMGQAHFEAGQLYTNHLFNPESNEHSLRESFKAEYEGDIHGGYSDLAKRATDPGTDFGEITGALQQMLERDVELILRLNAMADPEKAKLAIDRGLNDSKNDEMLTSAH